jgi:hypothetical protein
VWKQRFEACEQDQQFLQKQLFESKRQCKLLQITLKNIASQHQATQKEAGQEKTTVEERLDGRSTFITDVKKPWLSKVKVPTPAPFQDLGKRPLQDYQDSQYMSSLAGESVFEN